MTPPTPNRHPPNTRTTPIQHPLDTLVTYNIDSVNKEACNALKYSKTNVGTSKTKVQMVTIMMWFRTIIAH